MDKRRWGANGMTIIPGKELIFTIQRKHFNTLLLTEVHRLEPEYLQKTFNPLHQQMR